MTQFPEKIQQLKNYDIDEGSVMIMCQK